MNVADFEILKIDTAGATINLAHGGEGPPLLLIHGYPETHAMWHLVAPELAKTFHVVCPDLRGYGHSAKPASTADHGIYSKREMARDMVEVMAALGYETFYVAGHDRGARVTHRLALDYPEKVMRACVMDIAPTQYMYEHTDQAFATGYYHWFFLIQPDGLPERLIGADPAYFLTEKLKRWSAPGAHFDPEVVAAYIECFSQLDTIHATCEDYRAAAGIDLDHDDADRSRNIECPLLVLWGDKGFVHRTYDVLNVWAGYAENVTGRALSCGHFLAEEAPEAVTDELLRFFKR
ncbi:alpha/beta fold hydrolase [Marinobacter caseinilyticus]|uniref:alpha/beta fold hydrolase n=1 Tax=Marinobacter caseinilyticus TaxID=2692195 RepID=UPI00140DDE93|nr:alpha/beta hydrolase [Marinobacter caseinilyticus]